MDDEQLSDVVQVKEVSESYQLGDDKFLDITKSNLYDPLGLITPLEPDEDLSNGASATKKRKLGEDLPPLQRNTHRTLSSRLALLSR